MRIKNFGGYSLGEYLGGGLYTKVYKAYSFLAKPTYGNPVAIKILYLKGGIVERNKLIKQFEREAEIAMNLEHPNIVKVYNFGRFDHHYAMIMEYIDGKNLKEFLYEKGKWDLNKILRICYEAGKGLEYIHQHNIVHKDVKPDNILISFDFEKIKFTISVTSADVTDEDMKKAMELAEGKLCPVWAMIKGNVNVTYETFIERI